VEKYLHEYAEPGTVAVRDIPPGEPWGQVVVIPVCNESTEILRSLPPGLGRSLMIVVINEAGGAPGDASSANRMFASEIRSRFTMCWQSTEGSGLSLFRDSDSPRDVLLVDRFSEGLKLPVRGGVGQARKTGADYAAFLVQGQRISSPWIHCSDADVRLPPGYFNCSNSISRTDARQTAALLYPFRHRILSTEDMSEEIQQRILQITRLYEYSLRYYVAGLAYAGSPYAFHTIGSTIAVNAFHYAKVRGFPRRQAGEDFYLLNKLAKVGAVRQLNSDSDCDPIDIFARLSDRVPFGTGAAVGKIMEMEEPAREFLFYHPSVFGLLRDWLGSLPAFWRSHSCDLTTIPGLSDHAALVDGLEAMGAAKALRHALKQSSDAAQFERQMHTWFDAFRTLKLIHYLREHYLPSISFASLKDQQDLDFLLDCEPMLANQHKAMCESPGAMGLFQ
jgi:hypothetical protein